MRQLVILALVMNSHEDRIDLRALDFDQSRRKGLTFVSRHVVPALAGDGRGTDFIAKLTGSALPSQVVGGIRFILAGRGASIAVVRIAIVTLFAFHELTVTTDRRTTLGAASVSAIQLTILAPGRGRMANITGFDTRGDTIATLGDQGPIGVMETRINGTALGARIVRAIAILLESQITLLVASDDVVATGSRALRWGYALGGTIPAMFDCTCRGASIAVVRIAIITRFEPIKAETIATDGGTYTWAARTCKALFDGHRGRTAIATYQISIVTLLATTDDAIPRGWHTLRMALGEARIEEIHKGSLSFVLLQALGTRSSLHWIQLETTTIGKRIITVLGGERLLAVVVIAVRFLRLLVRTFKEFRGQLRLFVGPKVKCQADFVDTFIQAHVPSHGQR
jgi:hypothetical protein